MPGNGLSVGSQRNFSNSFIVDGVSANDDAAGLAGIPLAVESVEQFQVVTSGGQAELGRALGGYVSVVTRSGANALRGSAYWFLRDDSLNAANPLLGRTLPMHQNQYGLSLGGPIVRDRTFFFANVEQRDLDQSGLTTITPANVDVDQRAARGHRLSRLARRHRRLSEPGAHDARPRQARSPRRPPPAEPALQPLPRERRQLARRRAASSAPSASAGLDNIDHAVSLSDTLGAVAADGERDARAVRLRRPGGAADRSRRAGGEHRGRRVLRDALGQPHPAHQPAGRGRRHALAPGGRPRAAGGRGLPLQRHHDHLPALGARLLHVLVAGQLPASASTTTPGFTQTFGDPVVGADEPQPRALRPGRVARRARG